MQINGEWLLCDDSIVRPVIHGHILDRHGAWIHAPSLVDTGADRTVFSAPVLAVLSFQPTISPERLGGVGGIVTPVVIETHLRFRHEAGRGTVVFRGQFAAVTEREALDMSVLGRDITGLFALIVDQPGNVVCLLGQRHRYAIEQE
jgi:hypothetical protein